MVVPLDFRCRLVGVFGGPGGDVSGGAPFALPELPAPIVLIFMIPLRALVFLPWVGCKGGLHGFDIIAVC